MAAGRVVLILGMHRSGTSSIAEYVASLGYCVPGDQLEIDTDINERGYWESKQIVAFNEGILSHLSSSWYSVADVANFDAIDKELWLPMADWLTAQLRTNPNLVIKDPRISILLPVWENILSHINADIYYVNVSRHPDYVVQSLNKRDGFSYSVGYALWIKYNLKVFEYLTTRYCYFINYDNLISGESNLNSLDEYIPKSCSGNQDVIEVRLARNNNAVSCSNKIAGSARYLYQEVLLYQGKYSIDKDSAFGFLSFFSKNYYFFDDEAAIALDESSAELLVARSSMIENGRFYSEALSVIEDKDRGLQENKIYIDSCNSRIELMDSVTLDFFNAVQIAGADIFSVQSSEGGFPLGEENYGSDMFERVVDYIFHLKSSVVDLGRDLSKSVAHADLLSKEVERLNGLLASKLADQDHNERYISDCHFQIAYLQNVIDEKDSAELKNSNYIECCHREIARLNGVVCEKERGEKSNERYISECHQEIARLSGVIQEKEKGEASNECYIADCHREIARLFSIIEEKEKGERYNLDYIERCHQRISELDSHLAGSSSAVRDLQGRLLQAHASIAAAVETIDSLSVQVLELRNCSAELSDINRNYSTYIKNLMGVFSLGVLTDDMMTSDGRHYVFDALSDAIAETFNENKLMLFDINRLLTERCLIDIRLNKLESAITTLCKGRFVGLINNNILNELQFYD